MNRLVYTQHRSAKFIVVAALLIIYEIVFAIYHGAAGSGIAALAIIPVMGAAWYIGIGGGILAGVLSVLFNVIFLFGEGNSYRELFMGPAGSTGIFTLAVTAIVIGQLGKVTRERHAALLKLKEYERERVEHSNFLELLNKITGTALEADNLDSTLKILVERIRTLFDADDCFFSFWDEAKEVPLPAVAFGSMSDIYPYILFEPNDLTLTTSVMKARQPIAVTDTEDSIYMSSKIASIFPSRSMLGLPLIAQERKLGALLLGYDRYRSFDQDVLARGKITAEQIALVLSKAQLLEDERRQVKQLKALHDVALVSTQVNSEDELIERVTDIIGRNIFPDNFGILLLDESGELLHPHPSYRFFSTEPSIVKEVHLGEGVTGQVAKTGQPLRVGNVRRMTNYLDVDERTSSELCVPIKFREQLLGVINAESVRRNAFTEDDERLLLTLAGQLATAMEQLHKSQAERKWLDQLAHSNDLIYSLAHVTTHIEKALGMDGLIKTLGEELQKVGLTCATAQYNKQKNGFTFSNTTMESQTLERFENSIGNQLINYSFSFDHLRKVTSAGDPYTPAIVANPTDEMQIFFKDGCDLNERARILQEVGINDELELVRLPLLFENQLLGILWVWGNAIKKTDLPILSIFAKQIGISLERARLFEEVQNLAVTDSLTGLNNRRNLFELGRIEFSRAVRMNRPFCCMMLDLDHFKQINDRYGHQVGDQVLQEFARRCKDSVREVDLIGRYGGEEIVTFLPETDLKTAKQVAERLCASIAATPINASNQMVDITVSIGVSQKDENTPDLQTLIARADQAMYIAKHKGRNQVAISV